MTKLEELTKKIEGERPVAYEKLIDKFNEYMPAYDGLTVGDRRDILKEWRESLTREDIKELGKWVDLLYFEKVKREKLKGE